MALHEMTFDEWAERLAATRGTSDYYRYMGHSPGGAAAELDLSRQRIWQLVKDNKLDLITLRHPDEKNASAWIVTDASLTRFRKSKPGVQQSLPLANIARRVRAKQQGKRSTGPRQSTRS